MVNYTENVAHHVDADDDTGLPSSDLGRPGDEAISNPSDNERASYYYRSLVPRPSNCKGHEATILLYYRYYTRNLVRALHVSGRPATVPDQRRLDMTHIYAIVT